MPSLGQLPADRGEGGGQDAPEKTGQPVAGGGLQRGPGALRPLPKSPVR